MVDTCVIHMSFDDNTLTVSISNCCAVNCRHGITYSYASFCRHFHYNDVIMGAIASQITSLTIVCSTVYSDADQRKHQSSASLAFVRGIHRGPVNSPHKWPVTRKMFPFDDVIVRCSFRWMLVRKSKCYCRAFEVERKITCVEFRNVSNSSANYHQLGIFMEIPHRPQLTLSL